MTRLLALLLTCLALGLVIAACGDDEEESADTGAATTEQTDTATTEEAPADDAGGGELTLSADPGGGLKFDKDSLTAPAGEVTITMENPADVPHNVALEGDGVDEEGEIVEKGGTSTVSATVEAGEYTFYCSVPGHRQGGMEGTLTVTG